MQNLGILRPEAYSEYCESLKYSLHKISYHPAILKLEPFIRTLSDSLSENSLVQKLYTRNPVKHLWCRIVFKNFV